MHLVDNNCVEVSKEHRWIDAGRDEHRFERLWRCQQDVRGLTEYSRAVALNNVAVPKRSSVASECGVLLEPRQKVVEQCSKRSEVENGKRPQLLRRYTANDRETRRLGLSTSGRRQQ